MKKLLFLITAIVAGTALVAFTPAKTNEISFNDVTQSIKGAEMQNSFSKFVEFEHTRYTPGRIEWLNRYKTWTDPVGRTEIDELESSLSKY